MSVCYDKLWKILIDKQMNRTELKDKAGISFNVLAKMGKGESVSLESLHKICKTLECDIGVHQDGLVHISQMADRFIKHPLEVVSVGDVVDVVVVSVDIDKKRIQLSMKL